MARSGPTTKDTSTIPLGLAQIRVGDSASNIAVTTSVLPAAASIGALANTKFTGAIDYWKLESGFPLLEDLSLPIREAASLECAFKELTPYNLALARGIDPAAAVSATVTYLDKVTVGGGNAGAITVDNAGGVVSDTWLVTMDDATHYSVFGTNTGILCAGTAISVACAPSNGGHPYFTIPANFFDANWLADETYSFRTTAYVADGGYSSAHSGSIKLGDLRSPDFVRMEAVYTYPNQTNHMYVIFPRANVTSSVEIDWAAEDTIAAPITFEAKRSDAGVSGGNAAWDLQPLGVLLFD
jgi:hypothetical protein